MPNISIYRIVISISRHVLAQGQYKSKANAFSTTVPTCTRSVFCQTTLSLHFHYSEIHSVCLPGGNQVLLKSPRFTIGIHNNKYILKSWFFLHQNRWLTFIFRSELYIYYFHCTNFRKCLYQNSIQSHPVVFKAVSFNQYTPLFHHRPLW